MTEFHEQLPEDLRDHASLKDYKDLGGLAKSHVELQKKFRERPSSMADFDAPADADGRAKVYQRLGRPDSPDGYKLPADANGGREFRIAAHESLLTSEQAEALFSKLSVAEKTVKESSNARFKEQLVTQETKVRETYHTKWGDRYDEEMAFVDQAISAHIPDSAREEIKALGLHNEPWLIDLMNTVGHSMKEDGMFGQPGGGGVTSTNDLATVRAKRIAMDNDPEYAKIVKSAWHPQYKEKTEEYKRLMADESRLATKDGTEQPWGPRL